MVAPEKIGISTRVAGVWQRIDQPKTKVAGVWRDVKKVSTKVNGLWVPIFLQPAEEISVGPQTISALDLSAGPWVTSARYILKANGSARAERSPGISADIFEQWKFRDYGRNYEAMWVEIGTGGGSFTTPFAANTWTAISVDRTFDLTSTVIATRSRTFDVSIRQVGTTTTLDTARITLTVENGNIQWRRNS